MKSKKKPKINYNKFSESFYTDKIIITMDILKEIETHYKNGGLHNKSIIAAIIGCGHDKVYKMLNEKSDYYDEDFSTFINICKAKSIKRTDDYHLAVAIGKIKGDGSVMNRRASKILGLNEKQEVDTHITNDDNKVIVKWMELPKKINKNK